MSPPLVKDSAAPGGYKLDLDSSVESWHQVSAHDTATDCERAKLEKSLAAISAAPETNGKKGVSKDAFVEAALRALCVPADYIYGPRDEGEGSATPQSL